jgi:hypothetical protein
MKDFRLSQRWPLILVNKMREAAAKEQMNLTAWLIQAALEKLKRRR